jgi:hypothetical protein
MSCDDFTESANGRHPIAITVEASRMTSLCAGLILWQRVGVRGAY